jgi:protein PsiE
MGTKIANLIKITEKTLLAIIATLTVLATFEEVLKIYIANSVQLADLLLLFIYTEVLGMIGIFFVSNRIPITLPIFIAMTAISRLIILQGKEMDMSFLLYEAGAILVLALSVLVVRYKPLKTYTYQTDDED